MRNNEPLLQTDIRLHWLTSAKGGFGKSTIAIASSLDEVTGNVLVIDFDNGNGESGGRSSQLFLCRNTISEKYKTPAVLDSLPIDIRVITSPEITKQRKFYVIFFHSPGIISFKDQLRYLNAILDGNVLKALNIEPDSIIVDTRDTFIQLLQSSSELIDPVIFPNLFGVNKRSVRLYLWAILDIKGLAGQSSAAIPFKKLEDLSSQLRQVNRNWFRGDESIIFTLNPHISEPVIRSLFRRVDSPNTYGLKMSGRSSETFLSTIYWQNEIAKILDHYRHEDDRHYKWEIYQRIYKKIQDDFKNRPANFFFLGSFPEISEVPPDSPKELINEFKSLGIEIRMALRELYHRHSKSGVSSR